MNFYIFLPRGHKGTKVKQTLIADYADYTEVGSIRWTLAWLFSMRASVKAIALVHSSFAACSFGAIDRGEKGELLVHSGREIGQF